MNINKTAQTGDNRYSGIANNLHVRETLIRPIRRMGERIIDYGVRDMAKDVGVSHVYMYNCLRNKHPMSERVYKKVRRRLHDYMAD